MTLPELLPALRPFSRIVVTGPQRSGTTIATRILAEALGYEALLEEAFGVYSLVRFVEVLIEKPGRVLQAPALSSIVHLLRDADVAVVFMLRSLEAIQRSEERIGWRPKHDAIERSKYFTDDSAEPISALKRRVWECFQKRQLGEAAFELEYDSLASSPLWVEPTLRRDFHPRQTELSPVAKPPTALGDQECRTEAAGEGSPSDQSAAAGRVEPGVR